MKTNVFILLCLAALCAGCRQDLDLAPINGKDGVGSFPTYITTSDSYSALFKAFWQGMNENYVFWDVEPVGYWDDMWNTYKPKFDALGDWEAAQFDKDGEWMATAGTQKADTAREYIAEMVKPLKDGHLSIDFDESVSPRSRVIFVPNNRVVARYLPDPENGNPPNNSPKEAFLFNNWSDVPSDVNESNWNYIRWLIGPHYAIPTSGNLATLADGFHIAVAKIGTGTVPTDSTTDYIIYLSFNEFSITGNLKVEIGGGKPVDSILNQYLRDVTDAHCKGLIYDLRGNAGGANQDIPLLLSPLLTKDLHFAYTRTKKGVNRLDYMPWAPYILRANPADPADGIRAANAGTMQVVALINDYSISCGELMPLAIKSMPHGYLIGTRTWGATGPRWGDTSPAATHDGSFSGNKLWLNVTESGWQTKGRNFESYEGVGITPDEVIEFDWNEFRHGNKDVQLEAAIAHIKASLP
jgi:hypothetical protein